MRQSRPLALEFGNERPVAPPLATDAAACSAPKLGRVPLLRCWLQFEYPMIQCDLVRWACAGLLLRVRDIKREPGLRSVVVATTSGDLAP